ncbi:hypothetical protein ACXJJ3_33320 [Kribbella sp. WER1]
MNADRQAITIERRAGSHAEQATKPAIVMAWASGPGEPAIRLGAAADQLSPAAAPLGAAPTPGVEWLG